MVNKVQNLEIQLGWTAVCRERYAVFQEDQITNTGVGGMNGRMEPAIAPVGVRANVSRSVDSHHLISASTCAVCAAPGEVSSFRSSGFSRKSSVSWSCMLGRVNRAPGGHGVQGSWYG